MTIAPKSDVDDLLIEKPHDLRVGTNTEAENLDGVHFGEHRRDETNHTPFSIEGSLRRRRFQPLW